MDTCKLTITNILEDLCIQYPNYDVYASLIGYRDFGEKIHRVDFTKQHQYIYDELSYIDASDGEDQAEDISSAYAWANVLDWNADIKLAYHFADAPEHGLKFHDKTVTDNYPNGNPLFDFLEEINEFSNNNVDLTVFKINKSTNIMYSWMNKIYNNKKFRIHKLLDLNPTLN